MFNGVSSNWKGTVGGVGYRGPGCYAGVAGVGFFFVCVCVHRFTWQAGKVREQLPAGTVRVQWGVVTAICDASH
jgi:hypothetical protein